MINATNKIPWSPPVTVTAIGKLARYFKGIAINNKTKKEIQKEIQKVEIMRYLIQKFSKKK